MQQEEEEEEAAPRQEKMAFTVKLTKFDDAKKVQLIKAIKSLIPNMNLVQVCLHVEQYYSIHFKGRFSIYQIGLLQHISDRVEWSNFLSDKKESLADEGHKQFDSKYAPCAGMLTCRVILIQVSERLLQHILDRFEWSNILLDNILPVCQLVHWIDLTNINCKHQITCGSSREPACKIYFLFFSFILQPRNSRKHCTDQCSSEDIKSWKNVSFYGLSVWLHLTGKNTTKNFAFFFKKNI